MKEKKKNKKKPSVAIEMVANVFLVCGVLCAG
jgi:hypothetical protein